MSPEYSQAIALLAQKIWDSGCLLKISFEQLEFAWLWDSAVKLLPELKTYSQEVGRELNYQLSFNQCSNAIHWVYKFHPSEWEYLLVLE